MRLAAFLAFIPLLVACSGSPSSSAAAGGTTGSGAGGSSGSSTALHGTFTCGGATCDVATQLCDRAALDEGASGVSYEYGCVDLTAPCLTDHTCACVQSHGVVSDFIDCTADSNGGITVDSDLP